MDNYYTKYLKYKNKYIELKKQHGGVVGTWPCALSILPMSIWDNLQNYNCNYEAILKKFPKLQLSYNDFLINRDSNGKQIEVKDFKSRKFPAKVLKEAGFPASELKTAGYTLDELKIAGYTLSELNKAGFSLKDLKIAGSSLIELRKLAGSLIDLKDAGFTAMDFKKEGYEIVRIMCIFTNEELRQAGFTAGKTDPEKYLEIGRAVCTKTDAKTLKYQSYTANQLKDWYTLEDLIKAEFTDAELIEAGFSQYVIDDQKGIVK